MLCSSICLLKFTSFLSPTFKFQLTLKMSLNIPPPPPKRLPGQCFHMNIALLGDSGVGKSLLTDRFAAVENFDRLLREARNSKGDPIYCYDFEVARTGAPAHHYMLSQTTASSNNHNNAASTPTSSPLPSASLAPNEQNAKLQSLNSISVADSNSANLFAVNYRKGSIFQPTENAGYLSATSHPSHMASIGTAHTKSVGSNHLAAPAAGLLSQSVTSISKVIRSGGAGVPWQGARVSAREAETILEIVPEHGREYVPTSVMHMKRVQVNVRGCIDAALHRVFLVDTPGDEDRLSIIRGLFERKTLEDGLGGAIIICDASIDVKYPKEKILIDRRRSSLYGMSDDGGKEENEPKSKADKSVDRNPSDIRLSPSTPTLSSFAIAVAEHSRSRRPTEVYPSEGFVLDSSTPRSETSNRNKDSPIIAPSNHTIDSIATPVATELGVAPTLPMFAVIPPGASKPLSEGTVSNETSRRPIFFNTIHSEDAEARAYEGVTPESAASLTVDQIPPYLHRAMAMLHLCIENEVPAVILHVGNPPNPTAYEYLLHRYDDIIYRAVTLNVPEGTNAEHEKHKMFLMQARSLVDFTQYIHNYRIAAEQQLEEEYKNRVAEVEKLRHRSYSKRLEESIPRPLKFAFHADATNFEELNKKAHHILKVRLLGAPASGKTAFLHALLDNHRVSTYEPSKDLDVATCVIELKGKEGLKRLLKAREDPTAFVKKKASTRLQIDMPPVLKLGDASGGLHIAGPRASFLAFEASETSTTQRDARVSPTPSIAPQHRTFLATPSVVHQSKQSISPAGLFHSSPNHRQITNKPLSTTEQSIDKDIITGSQFYGKSTKHVLEQEALQAGLRLAATTRFANGKVVASTSRLTAQGASSMALDNRDIAQSTHDIIKATSKQCRVAAGGAEEGDILADALVGTRINTRDLIKEAEANKGSTLSALRARALRKSFADGPNAHAGGQSVSITAGATTWTPSSRGHDASPFPSHLAAEKDEFANSTSPTRRGSAATSIVDILQNRSSIFAASANRSRTSIQMQRHHSSLKSYIKRNQSSPAGGEEDDGELLVGSLLPNNPSSSEATAKRSRKVSLIIDGGSDVDDESDNEWGISSNYDGVGNGEANVDTTKLLGSERLIRAAAAAELARRSELENRDTVVKVTFFDGKKPQQFDINSKTQSNTSRQSGLFGAPSTVIDNPLPHSFSGSLSAEFTSSQSNSPNARQKSSSSGTINKHHMTHPDLAQRGSDIPPFNIVILFIDAAAGKKGLADAEAAIAEEPSASHILCILTKAEGTQAALESNISTKERRRSKFKRFSVLDSLTTRKDPRHSYSQTSGGGRNRADSLYDASAAVNSLLPEEEITYDEFDDFAGKLNAFSVVADARDCHRTLVANFITAIITFESKLKGRIQRKAFNELEPSTKMALSDSIYNALLELPSDGISATLTRPPPLQQLQRLTTTRGKEEGVRLHSSVIPPAEAELLQPIVNSARRVTISGGNSQIATGTLTTTGDRRMSSPRANDSITPDRRRQSVVTFAPKQERRSTVVAAPFSNTPRVIITSTPSTTTVHPVQNPSKVSSLQTPNVALQDLFSELDEDQDGFIDCRSMRDLHNRFDKPHLGSFKTALVQVLERGGRLDDVQMLLDANNELEDARKEAYVSEPSPDQSSLSVIKQPQLLNLRDLLHTSATASSFEYFAKLQHDLEQELMSEESSHIPTLPPLRSTILSAVDQKRKKELLIKSEIETGFESEFEKMINQNTTKSCSLKNASKLDKETQGNHIKVSKKNLTSPTTADPIDGAKRYSLASTVSNNFVSEPPSGNNTKRGISASADHWLAVLGKIKLTFDEFSAILMTVAKM